MTEENQEIIEPIISDVNEVASGETFIEDPAESKIITSDVEKIIQCVKDNPGVTEKALYKLLPEIGGEAIVEGLATAVRSKKITSGERMSVGGTIDFEFRISE